MRYNSIGLALDILESPQSESSLVSKANNHLHHVMDKVLREATRENGGYLVLDDDGDPD